MEYRRKCTVCGNVYCYDDKDVKKNTTNSLLAGISAIGGIASAFSGNKMDMVISNQNMQRNSSDKIIDFERCPMCNSRATIQLDGDSIETEPKSFSTTVAINSNATAESLLKRIRLLLEDKEWDKAKQYCEQVLDLDAENPYAYLYELLAEWELNSIGDLSDVSDYEEDTLYLKTIRFADPELKNQLLDICYRRYNRMLQEAETEDDYLEIKDYFDGLGEYKDSIKLKKKCSQYADEALKDESYNTALSLMKEEQVLSFENAVQLLEKIDGWKDSNEKIAYCHQEINRLKEQERIEWEKAEQIRLENEKAAKAKKKKIIVTVSSLFSLLAIILVLLFTVIFPSKTYNKAINCIEEGNNLEACILLNDISSFKDSEALFNENYEILLANFCKKNWNYTSSDKNTTYSISFEKKDVMIMENEERSFSRTTKNTTRIPLENFIIVANNGQIIYNLSGTNIDFDIEINVKKDGTISSFKINNYNLK